MGIVAIAFYVGLTIVSENFLADTILSLGLAIAFYYAITGLRVRLVLPQGAVQLRPQSSSSGSCSRCSARCMLTGAFVKSAIDMFNPDYGYTVLLGVGGVFVIGIGSLLLGVVLMIVWSFFPARGRSSAARASTATPRCSCPRGSAR